MTRMSLSENIHATVSSELQQCIRCNRCLDACPVTKTGVTIDELNQATQLGTPVSGVISAFAFSCVQCARCVPVCPVGLHRDEMMLVLRAKLRNKKPYSYKRYLAIRGPNLDPIASTAQRLFTALKAQRAPDLARFMERTPKEKAQVVFYPGCYLYSFDTMRRTLRLLDHIGTPYVVLGGMNTCCGIPHLLQGEFARADHCFNILHERLRKLAPRVVITGCAECLEALLRVKEHFRCDYDALSVVEYLMKNIKKFPSVKIRGPVTLHDSCRLTRRYNHGGITRKAISQFTDLVEMRESGDTAMCCYHWNHDFDPENMRRRRDRLAEAHRCATTMICDCITCYEEFKKLDTDVEVLDILQLFEETLTLEGKRNGPTKKVKNG